MARANYSRTHRSLLTVKTIKHYDLKFFSEADVRLTILRQNFSQYFQSLLLLRGIVLLVFQ